MEILIATIGLLLIGFTIIYTQKLYNYRTLLKKNILDTLPFIIFTISKKGKIHYRNNAAQRLVPKFRVLQELNKNINFNKDYQLINTLYLDYKHLKALKCYLFWQDTKLYCVGILKLLRQDGSSPTDNVNLVNNYVLLNNNLKLDIATILEYAGNLLCSDWVCFYQIKNNKCIEVAEYKKAKVKKINHTECDRIKYFKKVYPTARYKILHREDIKEEENLAKDWDTAGIKHKLFTPVIYNEKVYGVVGFSFYKKKMECDDPGLIQIITSIVNFIISIQLKIKTEFEYNKAIHTIQESLKHYMKTQAQHSLNMYERELYLYQCMSGPKDETSILESINDIQKIKSNNNLQTKKLNDSPISESEHLVSDINNTFNNHNWEFRGLYGRRYSNSRGTD